MPKQRSSPDRLFLALGDPTRMAVFRRLCRGPETVSGLAAPHKMALPSFMQHLRVLERSGWVRSVKTGRVRTCEIDPEVMTMAKGWLETQHALWEQRLDRLDEFLLKEKKEEQR